MLRNVTIGASVGVALVTALPFFGAVGAITATGTTVGSVGGGLAGFIDRISD
ncbi:hypothetical protein [Dethiosulfovibrio salsuginis]|uniref:hypothetical protein n=1 Tax=Dethiosulfovibrio salsuginis TaxID=561720 RepID=UPI001356608A|nr:hypothetical protein [Dethiosulfovibrio salsuginis]